MSRLLLATGLLLCSGPVAAHSFGRVYNLPVPLDLYLYGSAAALALSFLVAALLLRSPASALPPSRDVTDSAPLRWLRSIRLPGLLRLLSLGLLVLSVVSGFIGNRDPYVNFNMTFFWIIVFLGLTYATAVVGNIYRLLNPWRTLAEGIGLCWRGYLHGCLPWPAWLSYWPALLLYMALIWIELFLHATPQRLSWLLLGYTALNLVAVGVFGARAWFRRGELFSVLLRLMAKMSPLDIRERRVFLRWPGQGLLESHPQHWALLVFVLFTLSSTAFDGLRATRWWVLLFWDDKLNVLTPWLGSSPMMHYATLRPWYLLYESFWLLASPFVYLAVYLVFIWLSRWLTRSPLSVRELAFRFAYTLLPIALVYNITHYYTLLFTQGVKIVSQLSDPFGWGWNLFGTAELWRVPILPEMWMVWHTQVGLIVFGHVVSVYLAHVEALRSFGSVRLAMLSQLPMLVVMMLFTASGLWILAQPITGG